MPFLDARTRNAGLIEIGFEHWTDFIVVRYSPNKNYLPSNNLFPFQDNIVGVNRVWQIIWHVFVPDILLSFA
jgi:hypothetical protein